MDRLKLYTDLAERKSKPKDFEPYAGDNGRVNRALQLYKSGQLKAGGVHIDVGGGIGDLGHALRKEGLFEKTLVVDIAAKNLEAAKAKGNFVVLADMDQHGFNIDDPTQLGGPQEWSNDGFMINSQGRIDAISALDFIEHIVDPENFARHCFMMLKNSGEVFINTPNIRFFKHIEQLLIQGTFPHTSGDREVFHGGHLAFFTYKDLCNIFGSAGFGDFKMFMDDECFVHPPTKWMIEVGKPANQDEYRQLCMELGCPNLLFRAVKR